MKYGPARRASGKIIGRITVRPAIGISVLLLSAVSAIGAGYAQPVKPGVEKLYILNCGEGVAGDISRWSPGVNEGKSMEFVDNCYLIKHAQGWFLWDTGIPDAVAAMPNGLAPADPKAVFWRRPKTLAAQLDQLGVKPADIKAMAISHTHPDHIGNVEMFPSTMLYVQKAEYEWPGANNQPRFKRGASRHQTGGRSRRLRRRQRNDPVDAGTYAGPSIAIGETAKHRRDRAVRRCRSFQGELG